MRKIFTFVAIVLCSATVFAQNNSSSYPNGKNGSSDSSVAKAVSSSQSGASSDASGNSVKSSMGNVSNTLDLGNNKSTVTAAPGAFGPVGPIAAIMPSSQGTVLVEPGTSIPKDEVAWNAKGVKYKRLDVSPNPKNGILSPVVSSDNNVHLINWAPLLFVIPNSGDRIIASVRLYGGEYSDPMGPVYVALSKAIQVSGSTRCAVQLRNDIAVKVGGFSIGAGASISHASADNPVGIGGGAGFGKNTTTTPDSPDVEVFCLNNHPGAVSVYQPPQQQANANPQVDDLTNAVRALENAVKDLKQPLLPTPTQFTQPPANQPASNVCSADDFPGDFVITFRYGKSDLEESFPIKPGSKIMRLTHNNERIDKFVAWIRNGHLKCKVQIQGFACRRGNVEFDAGLAMDRAIKVRDEIIKRLGSDVGNMEFLSFGKEFANTEWDWRDRKARAFVLGPEKASDWDWHPAEADYSK